MNTENKLTPRAAACAAFSATLAMEELLAHRRFFKITRSTDNALFISVHDTGEPRALFKWRTPCRHLRTDSAPGIFFLSCRGGLGAAFDLTVRGLAAIANSYPRNVRLYTAENA